VPETVPSDGLTIQWKVSLTAGAGTKGIGDGKIPLSNAAQPNPIPLATIRNTSLGAAASLATNRSGHTQLRW
jgi:hypothetical protein